MNTINLTYNIIDDLKKCEGWRFKEKSRRRYVDAAHAAQCADMTDKAFKKAL